MAGAFKKVIVILILAVIAGCSKGDLAQSSKANQSATANQANAKSAFQPSGLEQLEKRAAGGDPVAQLDLAKVVLGNPGLPDRFTRAKGLLVTASQKGLQEAKLGLFILLGRKAISADGLPELEVLRNEVHAAEDHFVAVIIATPSSLKKSDSLRIVERAAATGSAIANAKIAYMWYGKAFDGKVCDISVAASIKRGGACPTKAETRESARRAIKIASALSEKEDVDAARYRFWRTLARELRGTQNDYLDKLPLDILVTKHVEPKRDLYFELIAEAKRVAGYLLAEGVGGDVDFLSAFHSYEIAAKLGDAEAQHALGELYEGGKGVPKDFEMAARYFAQSAQQGYAEGALALGKAYLRGQGVPIDPTKAYFWLNVASMGEKVPSPPEAKASLEFALQFYNAGEIRDVLARNMRPDDISEAQRLTREWRPSFQNGAPSQLEVLVKTTDRSSAAAESLSKKGTGTLFLVNAAGQAITNNHVVAGCSEVRIEGRDGLAKVVTEDAANDLALVQIPGDTKSSASITSEPGKLRQGEDIVAFGFPLNAVLSSGGNLTPGVVSALTGLGNNSNQIQITAPIQPGSSGSPVLNKKGEVVGVVSMKLSDIKMAKATGSVGQNVNFAVNGQTLKTFLDTHKVSYRSGSSFFSREKSAADLADEARKWTLVVECWN